MTMPPFAERAGGQPAATSPAWPSWPPSTGWSGSRWAPPRTTRWRCRRAPRSCASGPCSTRTRGSARRGPALEEVADHAREPRALPGERGLSSSSSITSSRVRQAPRVLLRDIELVQPVGLVARAHHQRRRLERLEQLQAVEGLRVGHHPQRRGHGLRVLVALHALARGLARDLLPALRQVVGRRDLHEGVDAALSSARASFSHSSSSTGSAVRPSPRVGRRDLHQRGHALGVLERLGHHRGGAHRAAHENGPLELEVVEHGLEVAHQVASTRRPDGSGRGRSRRGRGRRRRSAGSRGAAGGASPARRCGAWR